MAFKTVVCVVHCSEADCSRSQPTGDSSTTFYQLASDSQPVHPVITGKYQHNDARPASATATVSPAMHESVTELPSSISSLDARRDAIRQQMVELNRQRLLAQAKVDELRLQEQQFTQQVSATLLIYMQGHIHVRAFCLAHIYETYLILYNQLIYCTGTNKMLYSYLTYVVHFHTYTRSLLHCH